jgi:membrane fusion protein, multidrug efflux system
MHSKTNDRTRINLLPAVRTSTAPSRSTRVPGYFSALLVTLALALGACKDKSASAEPAEALPAVVQTEAVTSIEVPRTLRLTGTLRGNREVDLAANANGRVMVTAVERGEQIKPGQVLAKLDVRAAALSAAEARAMAASSRAQESQARVECDRYEQLKAKGAISDLEYQQKITQCQTLPLSSQAASARAALAAQNVGDGIIRAPFEGVITERYIEVGQYVRQDSRIATIVSLDPIRVEIAVPEAEVGKVREGAELGFTVAAYPGRRFDGKIRFVSGALRATTRDLLIEALVSNPDRALMPGMFADVELTVGTQQLPGVPKRAIVTKDEQARVFAVVEGHLEERVIAVGPEVAGRVAVTRGVLEGEKVVVSELAALTNGLKVR